MEHEVLKEIAEYCAVAGIKETTLGSLAVKDSRFVNRIREGRVTIQRIERARRWMEENPAKERAA